MTKNKIENLKNLWESGNIRNFRRFVYMNRKDLEEISERYVDAVEIILGCDNFIIMQTLMNTLLEFTSKYSDGLVSKDIVTGTVDFSIQMVCDIA